MLDVYANSATEDLSDAEKHEIRNLTVTSLQPLLGAARPEGRTPWASSQRGKRESRLAK